MSDHAVPHSVSGFLAVGISLHITLSQDETNAQYGSSILGWKQGSWLICEWPFHLGKPIPCGPGTGLLLRYIYQGKMIGFHSEILNTHVDPFPFLLLSFPSTLDEVPLRKHCRMPANEPILLRHVNDGLPIPPLWNIDAYRRLIDRPEHCWLRHPLATTSAGVFAWHGPPGRI